MASAEMKNAPPLYGWAIACAAGLVGGAVSFLLVGIEGNGSVAIAGVVTLLVGLVFTIAERPAPPAKTQADVTLASRNVAPNDTKPSAVAAPAAATTTASVSEPAATPSEEGTKPTMLSAPVGAPDDLKAITGVGPVLESKLNEMGVYHFWQIARWSDAEVTWVEGTLNFKGRIDRDGWIAQAKTLAEASPAKPPA